MCREIFRNFVNDNFIVLVRVDNKCRNSQLGREFFQKHQLVTSNDMPLTGYLFYDEGEFVADFCDTVDVTDYHRITSFVWSQSPPRGRFNPFAAIRTFHSSIASSRSDFDLRSSIKSTSSLPSSRCLAFSRESPRSVWYRR